MSSRFPTDEELVDLFERALDLQPEGDAFMEIEASPMNLPSPEYQARLWGSLFPQAPVPEA